MFHGKGWTFPDGDPVISDDGNTVTIPLSDVTQVGLRMRSALVIAHDETPNVLKVNGWYSVPGPDGADEPHHIIATTLCPDPNSIPHDEGLLMQIISNFVGRLRKQRQGEDPDA